MEIEIKKKESSEVLVEAIFPIVKIFALMYFYNQGKISKQKVENELKKGLSEIRQKPRDKKIPSKYDKILTN